MKEIFSMGAMIHAHIEVKKDGKWFHYAAPVLQRDYELFALIARVRAEGWLADVQRIATGYGLPEDMSEVTRICHEQDSGYGIHDEGYMTAADVKALQEALYARHPEVLRTGIDKLDLEYSVFKTYINGSTLAVHDGWDDLRVVFWFDN